jgi:hypothetical protein
MGRPDFFKVSALDMKRHPLKLDSRSIPGIITANRRAFQSAMTEESRQAEVARDTRISAETALNGNRLKFPLEPLG